jgi:hypothetical protein
MLPPWRRLGAEAKLALQCAIALVDLRQKCLELGPEHFELTELRNHLFQFIVDDSL